ncbi:MAG: helix-turn-helix domain-containing protein [Actinomycetia bacterium]|nr:helix-turn-helix domain-containing protein [Actinomycetes bacterium]
MRKPMTRPKTAAQASVDGVPELVALGSRIRQLRTDRHLSQEDLAAGAGINRVTLSKIERGVEDVGVVRLYRIAQALEVRVVDLFINSGPEVAR